MANYKSREDYDREDWERYKQKQRDIFERRKAKFEAEGYKCKHEGCNQSFRDAREYNEHYNQHQQQMREALICNQANCGKKFEKEKDFVKHIKEHKVVAKRRTLNCIRAVLLYNKHGLLLDSFEREYKMVNGKAVPFKFLGHDSLYDLMISIPEIVSILPLDGGQFLLLAVPDEKTEHMAKMVGNQRDNIEGFNRRTAEVLSRAGNEVKMVIEETKGIKDGKVSNFVKKQFVDLLESDEHIDGIMLHDLSTVYYKEYGYKIDYEEFGFTSLEEFCFHGLSDTVDMDLDKLEWKIVEQGMIGNTVSINKSCPIPDKIKNQIRTILEKNPEGMSLSWFHDKYIRRYKSLTFRRYGHRSLVEFMLSIPDVVIVSQPQGQGSPSDDDTMLYPSSHQSSHDNGIMELAANVKQLLEDHSEGVSLKSFVSGYEGYYGNLQESMTAAGVSSIPDLLQLCSNVCQLQTSNTGEILVMPVSLHDTGSSSSSISILLRDLHKIFSSCENGQIPVVNLPQSFRKAIGENLNSLSFGFSNIEMLVQYLVDQFDSSLQLANDVLSSSPSSTSNNQHQELLPNIDGLRTNNQGLESGWIRINAASNPDTLSVQNEITRTSLKKLESEMEIFYTWNMKGEKVKKGNLRCGDLVAALHSDLLWHRAKVLSLGAEHDNDDDDVVQLEYLDWGWRALVKVDTLRRLETMFMELPWQAVTVRCSQFKMMKGVEWSKMVREGRGRGLVSKDDNGNLDVELFVAREGKPVDSDSDIVRKFRKILLQQISKMIKH